MSILITDPNILALQNTVERINITIRDTSVNPPVNADPTELKLQIMNTGGTLQTQDIWPTPSNRIIRDDVGKFHIDFGQPIARLNGSHPIGSGTLNIQDASPLVGAGWASSGTLTIEPGTSNSETLSYSSLSITAGVGTITLSSLTTILHASLSSVEGTNTETSSATDYMLNWKVTLISGGETTNVLQKVKVMSVYSASFLPDLRQIVDKSKKLIDPNNDVFLGYTDSQLMTYLEGGLTTINAYQPSVTFTFDNFPQTYKQILIDAALITGAMSQQLYAIDTDIPNYNDQGTSFVISHQQQLAGFLNQVTQRLDKLIPMMKLQLINSGYIHTQIGPNFRLNALIQASPSGALFRGIFFRG